MSITYASSLTDMCALNSSFDKGVLRIAYPGVNQNKSCISKETFEKCIATMYNCPVVCNYDRETDTFGGHDVEIVKDTSGGLHMVNVTTPIGVICESSKHWWDIVTEDDGTEREYLFTEVLLWKRQEGYQKLKRDGISAHSMEINVKSGELKDGIYYVNDFEFTAFAIIGVKPCFESSAIEVFSSADFESQMQEMMRDFKESFNLVNTSIEVDDINANQLTRGGNDLEKETKIETEEKIESESYQAEQPAERDSTVSDEPVDEEQKFALVEGFTSEVIRELGKVTVTCDWGECPRYMYADCDIESKTVYAWDTDDMLLYGFALTVNGDAVSIDYDSKKRMKYTIVEFDGAEQGSLFESSFANVKSAFAEKAVAEASLSELKSANEEMKMSLSDATESIKRMESELGVLRRFKADFDENVARGEREELFSKFTDLSGVEGFDALCQDCMKYSLEELEEKCYALRGRYGTAAKFSLENAVPKIAVVRPEDADEPYGGLFVKYSKEK